MTRNVRRLQITLLGPDGFYEHNFPCIDLEWAEGVVAYPSAITDHLGRFVAIPESFTTDKGGATEAIYQRGYAGGVEP